MQDYIQTKDDLRKTSVLTTWSNSSKVLQFNNAVKRHPDNFPSFFNFCIIACVFFATVLKWKRLILSHIPWWIKKAIDCDLVYYTAETL